MTSVHARRLLPDNPARGFSSAPGQGDAAAWLARELHDGVIQRLTLMVVEIELLKRNRGLAVELEHIQQSARDAVADLRRLLYTVRDESAVDTQFVDSIRDLLTEFQAISGMAADLTMHSWPRELPCDAAYNLKCIVGETLNNARRHSGARRVTATLQVVDEVLAVTLTDDGRGIEDIEGSGGFGVRGMRERASLLGGRLTIDSSPEQGTTVHCMVPMAALR